MVRSLPNLHVPHLSNHLSVVVLIPDHRLKAGNTGENLVADKYLASTAEKDERLVLFNHVGRTHLGHKHVHSTDSAEVCSNSEPDSVPACLSVDHSELFTIGEELGSSLDLSRAFYADRVSELLHALHKTIDVVEVARLLLAPHLTIVVAGC